MPAFFIFYSHFLSTVKGIAILCPIHTHTYALLGDYMTSCWSFAVHLTQLGATVCYIYLKRYKKASKLPFLQSLAG